MKKILMMMLFAIIGVTTISAQSTNKKVYDVVEQMPEYPGGMEALMAYFREQVKYPADAKEKKIQGRVLVKFIVEKDGSVSNVKVVQKAYPSLDAEALRVVKAMPKWQPGKHEGKAVRVKYNIPIAFHF